MKKLLMLVLYGALSAAAHGQTELIVQIEANPESGTASLTQQYGPLRIVKPLARSSVLLRKALTNTY